MTGYVAPAVAAAKAHPTAHVDLWIRVSTEGADVKVILPLHDTLQLLDDPDVQNNAAENPESEAAERQLISPDVLRAKLQQFSKSLPDRLEIFDETNTRLTIDPKSVRTPDWPKDRPVNPDTDGGVRLTWRLQFHKTGSDDTPLRRLTLRCDFPARPSGNGSAASFEQRMIRLHTAHQESGRRIDAEFPADRLHSVFLEAPSSSDRIDSDPSLLTDHTANTSSLRIVQTPLSLIHEVRLPAQRLIREWTPEENSSWTDTYAAISARLEEWARDSVTVKAGSAEFAPDSVSLRLFQETDVAGVLAEAKQPPQTDVGIWLVLQAAFASRVTSESQVQLQWAMSPVPLEELGIALDSDAESRSTVVYLPGLSDPKNTAVTEAAEFVTRGVDSDQWVFEVPTLTVAPVLPPTAPEATEEIMNTGGRMILWGRRLGFLLFLAGLVGFRGAGGMIFKVSQRVSDVAFTMGLIGILLVVCTSVVKPSALRETAARKTCEQLLQSAYQAAVLIDEEQRATAIDGLFCESIVDQAYLDVCGSLNAIQPDRAPLARLREVRLTECRPGPEELSQTPMGWSAVCGWKVTADVFHYGHWHTRSLQLFGVLRIREEDGTWQIRSWEPLGLPLLSRSEEEGELTDPPGTAE